MHGGECVSGSASRFGQRQVTHHLWMTFLPLVGAVHVHSRRSNSNITWSGLSDHAITRETGVVMDIGPWVVGGLGHNMSDRPIAGSASGDAAFSARTDSRRFVRSG